MIDMCIKWLDKATTPSKRVNSNVMKPGNVAEPVQGPRGERTSGPLFAIPNPSAPSTNVAAATNRLVVNQNDFKPVNNHPGWKFNARFSKPGLLSILVQGVINGIGGFFFAYVFVLPHIGGIVESNIYNFIHLSCLMVPVFELFSSAKENELHYKHYSMVGGSSLAVGSQGFQLRPILAALVKDSILCVGQSLLSVTMLAPIISFAALSPFSMALPSYWSMLQSLLISYMAAALLVFIMAIQDVITRWAVCAPGMDADELMFRMTSPNMTVKGKMFLAEDLIIQSILMGDGETVNMVIAPPGPSYMSSKKYQDDEITRNEIASASFSEWIQKSSTTSSGKLCDDILRMCVLESLGGGGSSAAGTSIPHQSNTFHFGDRRHSNAVRKRLDLSAATASPGTQPIVVPIARALCAFVGGMGDAMSEIYKQFDKDGKQLRKIKPSELWILTPGSLNAVEYALCAAARIVVMNSVTHKHGRFVVNATKRHERLSLLLPCVLQSAYKLRCGIYEYAQAKASIADVNVQPNENGRLDRLQEFIVAKCPDLCPVISACNDSAKMAMKTLVDSGERLEDVLLRNKAMEQFLIDLNCAPAPVVGSAN